MNVKFFGEGCFRELSEILINRHSEGMQERVDVLAHVSRASCSTLLVVEMEHTSEVGHGVLVSQVRPDALQRRLLVARLGEDVCRALFDKPEDVFRWIFVKDDELHASVDFRPRTRTIEELVAEAEARS